MKRINNITELIPGQAYIYEMKSIPGIGDATFYMIYLGRKDFVTELFSEKGAYCFWEFPVVPVDFRSTFPVVAERRFYAEAEIQRLMTSLTNVFMRLPTRKEKREIAKVALCTKTI